MRNSRIRSFIAVFILVVFMIGLAVTIFLKSDVQKKLVLNDGWTVEYKGKSFEGVSLNSFDLNEKCNRGDIIKLKKTLDLSEIDEEDFTMRIYTRLSALKVKLADRVIYDYFGDWENTKAFVGSAYHFVILPFDLQNKEIEITITATENGAYSSLPVVVVSPSDKAYSDFANEREIGMMMSIFLMVAGFAMTVISVFGMTWDEDFKPILMIGLFAFLSGIWSFFAMKGAELFSNRFVFNSLVEYVALYIMPIP
ncbi:MAG: hypothetical protein K6F00_06510, partial [Lachnospiraceae bacterium]|nr:hypothetical protein [Lachnospiraceae bacterium]